MARICPQCSLENTDQAIFCSRCGFQFAPEDAVLSNNNVPTPTPPTMPGSGYAGYGAQANPQQAGMPQYGPPPAAGSTPYEPPSPRSGAAQSGMYGYGSMNNDPYAAPGGGIYQQQQFVSPDMQAPQGQQYHPGMQPPPVHRSSGSGAQKNIGQRLSVVRRAFAGKGTPLVHTSWLLEGKQVAPEDMRVAIIEEVQQRYANEVKVTQERLEEHETVLEERDYVRIQRAPANVFIYVAQSGSDLYIARTTTVEPALSPVRIAVFAALFVLMLLGFIISAASGSATIVALFSALLLIFFVVVVIHSLVLGFTENDFLVYLRPNILNDFRIDDGAILEHMADRGIRQAAEKLELDTGEFSMPAHSYPARRPLHVI